MNSEIYYTIEKTATAEFKDRGSRFIAYVCPIMSAEDFRLQLSEIKKEHHKATHHCYAYRLGLDGNKFRVSDDGSLRGRRGGQSLGRSTARGL
jgi:putative IMPACT (imprinted ancient) family translation regulator